MKAFYQATGRMRLREITVERKQLPHPWCSPFENDSFFGQFVPPGRNDPGVPFSAGGKECGEEAAHKARCAMWVSLPGEEGREERLELVAGLWPSKGLAE